MNQPRPFLTALCFALFAAVFVASNARSHVTQLTVFCYTGAYHAGDHTIGHSPRP